jgi:hypothetical protein
MYICGTSYYIGQAYKHVMFILERTRAQKLLKKAFKVHRSGKKALARRLFAIARRAIRYAKEYDLLEMTIGDWYQYRTQEPSDMLDELSLINGYLYHEYGKFNHLCQ